MALPTAADAAANWAQKLAGATSRIQSGVQSVSVSPGQKAAAQAAVWVQNTQAAQSKFQRNSAAVSLSEWQQATLTKGLPRVAGGASAAQPKMEAFMSKLLPYIGSQLGSLPPRGTFDQNVARMSAWAQAMHKFTK